MTLLDVYATSLDGDFIKRVGSAMYSAALAIVGENASAFSSGKADKRHALGVKVLGGDSKTLSSFVKAVGSNIGDVADPSTLTDSQINTSVSGVWDDIAGVLLTEA